MFFDVAEQANRIRRPACSAHRPCALRVGWMPLAPCVIRWPAFSGFMGLTFAYLPSIIARAAIARSPLG